MAELLPFYECNTLKEYRSDHAHRMNSVPARLIHVSVLLQASIAIVYACKDAGDQIAPSPVTVRMAGLAPQRMGPVSVHLAIEDPCAREVSSLNQQFPNFLLPQSTLFSVGHGTILHRAEVLKVGAGTLREP